MSLTIYLISVVSSIRIISIAWLIFVSFALFVSSFFILLFWLMDDISIGINQKKEIMSKKRIFIASIFLVIAPLFFCILLPSERDMYAMLAVSYAKENPKANALIDKAYKAIEVQLDEVIKSGESK